MSPVELQSRSTAATESVASFTSIGSIHLHVDGGEHIAVVKDLLSDLKTLGLPGKMHAINDIVAGPQRQEMPSVYSSHTPGTNECEQFEFFSTIGLADSGAAISTLKYILPLIQKNSGIVIEVEHVVANIDYDGIWDNVRFDSIAEIASETIGFRRLPTLPFEIHHCIDVYDAGSNPIDIKDFMMQTRKLGISLGGWFTFVKEGRAAYRSNAFSDGTNLKTDVFTQYRLLKEYLQSTGLNIGLKTIVEHVLGVWKIP